MKYAFEGIGPQPPETVIHNPDKFTLEQRRDAAKAYAPTYKRIMQETQQRVAAAAGEYATQQARKAAQATSKPFVRGIDLEGSRQVRIIDLPDSLPPKDEGFSLVGDPYIIQSDLNGALAEDPKEIRRLANLITTERHFPMTKNIEYDVREAPQPAIEEGERNDNDNQR